MGTMGRDEIPLPWWKISWEGKVAGAPRRVPVAILLVEGEWLAGQSWHGTWRGQGDQAVFRKREDGGGQKGPNINKMGPL